MRRDMVIEKAGGPADGARGIFGNIWVVEQKTWVNGYRYDISQMESLHIARLTFYLSFRFNSGFERHPALIPYDGKEREIRSENMA